MREALVVGLGLIGGSIALRLRERGWTVRYSDPDVATDQFERGDDAPLVIIATPVDVAIGLVRQPRSGTVTSVCSVLKPLRDAATGHFIAGHPMAGSEERGFAAARADLFEGKPWFVDWSAAALPPLSRAPESGGSAAALHLVEQLVRDCGAVLERVDAAEHDEAVALTSHLPQVLSTALAALIADRPDALRFAGSGLKTFLRLAGSDASVWKPVLETNADNIAKHEKELERVVRALLAGDTTAFEKAKRSI